MMHNFLANNRDDLIARCKVKVSRRPLRAATEDQLRNGIPMFLDQLQRTLAAEDLDQDAKGLKISGASGGDILQVSEVGLSAAAHGRELLKLGFSVNQLVHDYGDLCQSITDLAFERDAPFTISEFRTLNRCLDNAIADAVTEFSAQRDATIARQQSADSSQRIGFLVHELRNSLGTAILAVAAMEQGNLALGGATGTILKRSLDTLKHLIDRSLAEVRIKDGSENERTVFLLQALVVDAENASLLNISDKGCKLLVLDINPLLDIYANRELILGALSNLIQNAFKFTHANTDVTVNAYSSGDFISIDVSDHCGGLPDGDGGDIFTPFAQRGDDRTGLGLGLSISRQNIEADGGTLTVRDVPGTGCVFTISLPQHTLQ
jgi:signal transduction histidine kinase